MSDRLTGSASEPAFSVLVFSKTTGYRHESIEAGTAAIQALGAEHNFAVSAGADASVFNDDNLSHYAVVLFLNPSGDVLDAVQKAAMQRFIRNGGAFVGIHSATDVEYDWAWYGQLVGAFFTEHPKIQTATVHVVDSTHPSTSHLPAQWRRCDEWYNFDRDPSPQVTVLARVDESTYEGGRLGDNHPIAWYHEFDGGRSWYTAMGHTAESYSDPLFRDHILGGILWAAGVEA